MICNTFNDWSKSLNVSPIALILQVCGNKALIFVLHSSGFVWFILLAKHLDNLQVTETSHLEDSLKAIEIIQKKNCRLLYCGIRLQEFGLSVQTSDLLCRNIFLQKKKNIISLSF